MRAPVVGLTTYRESASWGVWSEAADLLPTGYAATVEATGAIPVLLPPVDQVGAADTVVRRLDAVIISGGADVDPGRYDAPVHERTTGWRPDRDAWELAVLDAAEAVQLPVLGICRGMQLMAVHAGGTLLQHLPDLVGDRHSPPDQNAYGRIAVTTTPGTRLAGLVGPALAVNCHHHQAVRTHPGFAAVAHAEDGTMEAMEEPGDRFRVAVQWHPETTADVGLLAGLVRAAAKHAATRGPGQEV